MSYSGPMDRRETAAQPFAGTEHRPDRRNAAEKKPAMRIAATLPAGRIRYTFDGYRVAEPTTEGAWFARRLRGGGVLGIGYAGPPGFELVIGHRAFAVMAYAKPDRRGRRDRAVDRLLLVFGALFTAGAVAVTVLTARFGVREWWSVALMWASITGMWVSLVALRTTAAKARERAAAWRSTAAMIRDRLEREVTDDER